MAKPCASAKKVAKMCVHKCRKIKRKKRGGDGVKRANPR
jgi:hypothetical protein